MDTIQYDDSRYARRDNSDPATQGMTARVIRLGFAKDYAGAQRVLLFAAGVFFVLALIIFFRTVGGGARTYPPGQDPTSQFIK